INFGFTQPIQMRISEMLTGSSGDLSIKIFGNDIAQLARLADETAAITRGLAGSVDVQTSSIDGGKFLNVDVHAELAQRFDMSTAQFARYLKTQLEGAQVSEIIEGKKRTPIVFAVDPSGPQALTTINALRQKVMVMPDGRQAPLAELAEVSFQDGPFLIERERGNRFAVVTSNVSGRDIVGFVDELETAIAEQLVLPTGYRVEFGGEFENQQRATRNLLLVIPAALLLIAIILFTTFGSVAQAALILCNIPFALMGGLIALFITGQYLSVPASVGLIALLGVAVLNAVVMVSYFEQTRLSVRDISLRVIQGSARRLRPVLMTATTAMFGLMPLAFATGPGAEIQKPLAIVVIGGLFSSTITTLYLLPLFYYHLEKRRHG
ncbi:MAG: efflux RND transporter permease subunit, partial [Halioglobus sp.]|nr:efflux RND transporter permease subunit [Halioglobus sp.]